MGAASGPWFRTSVALFVGIVLVLGVPAAPASAQGTTHIVKPGETLATIARAHGSSVGAIASANGLSSPDLIYVGQRLVVPGSGSSSGVPASSGAGTSASTTYVVKSGDTLAAIASRLGVSQAALISANKIANPNVLRIGQKLVVPAGSARSAVPQPKPATPKYYTVKAGDTLSRIAAANGTTAGALARANGLSSPDLIRVGMRLVITPGGAAAPVPDLTAGGRPTKLVVSISKQHCWLYRGEAVIIDWVCSTGRRAAPTRPGNYKIQSKLPKAYGSAWNIWMPYWLGIYWAGSTENGIHGVPYKVSNGWRMWEGLVGTPITYGCIMLEDRYAKALYDAAYIGMPVIVKR